MKKIILCIALLFPAFAFAVNPAPYRPDPIVAFARIQQALPAIQAGNATLNTDGKGAYWVSKKAFDPTSGEALPNINTKIDVVSAQAALPILQTFLTLVPNAAVGVNPLATAQQANTQLANPR